MAPTKFVRASIVKASPIQRVERPITISIPARRTADAELLSSKSLVGTSGEPICSPQRHTGRTRDYAADSSTRPSSIPASSRARSMRRVLLRMPPAPRSRFRPSRPQPEPRDAMEVDVEGVQTISTSPLVESRCTIQDHEPLLDTLHNTIIAMAQLRSESKVQRLLHQKAEAQTLLDKATITELKACLTEAELRRQQDESLMEDLRRERDRLREETSHNVAEPHRLRSAHAQLASSSLRAQIPQEHLTQIAGPDVQPDLDPSPKSRLEAPLREFHLTESTGRAEQTDSCLSEYVDNRSPHTVADKGAHGRQAAVSLQSIAHLEDDPDRPNRRLDPAPHGYDSPEAGLSDDISTPRESHRSQANPDLVTIASTDSPPRDQAPPDIENVLRAIVLQTVQERDAARHASQTTQAELEIARERALNLQVSNSKLLKYELDVVELRNALAHIDQARKTDLAQREAEVTSLKQQATVLGDEYSRRNKELETLLEEHKHTIQTRDAELQDLRLRAQDHKSSDQARDDIEQVLRAILLHTVQERDAANINTQNAEAQLKIANENVAKLEASCSELRKYETAVGELEMALAQTRQEWASYREERDGTAASLEQEMASLRHEYDNCVKQRDASVAEQISGMTTHAADLRNLMLSLAEIEESQTQLQKSMSRVEDELRSVQERYKDASSGVERLRLKCAELSSSNAGLAEQIGSLEAYKNNLELEVELQNFALQAGYIHDEQHLCRLKVPGFAKGLIKLQRLADAVLESRPKENSTTKS